MGLGEEGGRRKRTSDVSTTFTANTTVKCSCYSFHAAGLAPGQEFLFLTKIVTTGWADSVGRSILAALWASQHRRHGPPGPPPPCAAKPACPELRQATSQALAHQGSGSHSQADLQSVPHSLTYTLAGSALHWQPGATVDLLGEGKPSPQPEGTRELRLLGRHLIISQPLASLMNAGHSAFGLQHFLELALGK